MATGASRRLVGPRVANQRTTQVPLADGATEADVDVEVVEGVSVRATAAARTPARAWVDGVEIATVLAYDATLAETRAKEARARARAARGAEDERARTAAAAAAADRACAFVAANAAQTVNASVRALHTAAAAETDAADERARLEGLLVAAKMELVELKAGLDGASRGGG